MSERKLLLDVKEVAGLMGVSRRAIWTWADDGTFPEPLKFGRLRRWHRDSVEKFLADKAKAQEVAHGA